MEKTP
jgi:hypothetical protein